MADGLLGGGAAFGFYPQMKPRRQGSPADSANLPIDVLRGRLAGLLGLPADMANLFRSPSPTEMFGDVNYDAPAQFPYTTDRFLKELPLAPTSRVGQLAGQAASFVPLNPMPAVRGVQRVGQIVGEELGATMMGQRPNSLMSKVVPQPLFAVPPEQGLFQTKPQAPVSDIGFYSAAEQAALNLARNKGTGQSFLNDLMKAPDVKKEELAFTGLDDFLANKPNVTKQEIQDFIGQNKVAVNEVVSGAPIVEDPLGIAKRKAVFDKYEPEIQDLYRRIDKPEYVVYDPETNKVLKNYTNYDDALLDNLDPMGAFAKTKTALRPKENSRQLQQQITDIQNLRDAQADALYTIPESTPTKFGKFQLPGGENYREIRLTLPNKPMDAGMAAENWYTQFIKRGGDSDWSQLHPDRRQEIMNSMPAEARNLSASPEYRSSHFDEPNILAHMRVNDRIDADGKKMLLVEEIQSDWHQAGREKGYKSADSAKAQQEFTAYSTELANKYNLNPEQNLSMYGTLKGMKPDEVAKYDRLQSAWISTKEGVPDAPFKDTWYQLALKRLTKYAADNGYERIGLTTGQQQANRYKLSNEVDEINVVGRTDARTGEKSRSVALDLKSGGTYKLGVNNEGIIDNVNMLEINNLQGKKLADVVGKDIAKQIMEGSSQTIKGEGLNIGGEGMMKYYDEIYPKFLDKYGKKYGAKVGETQITTDYARDASGIPAQRPSKETIRYLDVTPEMKQGTSKGQPLFAAVPALPFATLDYTDPFPDTAR